VVEVTVTVLLETVRVEEVMVPVVLEETVEEEEVTLVSEVVVELPVVVELLV